MLRYFFVLLSFFIFVSTAEARDYIDVTGLTFKQIPIVLGKWKSSEKTPPSFTEKVYEILANDLALSGFFKVIDAANLPGSLREREGIPNTSSLQEWTPSGGDFLLAGETLFQPGSLNFKLTFHLFYLLDQTHVVGKQ